MQSHQQIDSCSRQLIKLAGVQTIIANSANRQFLNSYTKSIDLVIVILILIAALLAVVVIYNLTNINVAERVRELSTIKVLGFYDREVTLYIYRETIVLSLIGILVGFIFGWWLHQFIILNLPPDQAMFDPGMHPLNFLLSAAIPAIITGLMAIWVHQHLKKINMLDALASLD
jgi:putative ABC transport system permease protein